MKKARAGAILPCSSARSLGAKRGRAKKVKVACPKDWERTLKVLRFLRAEKTAQVDRLGCEMLADVNSPDAAFHCLVAAMLSALTKDAATAAAVQALRDIPMPAAAFRVGALSSSRSSQKAGAQALGALTPAKVDALSENQVADAIRAVGFYRTKAANLKKTARMLLEQFGGRVPDTKEQLLGLPGVGPKMAILVLQAAFGQRGSGVCVDVHVHRLCNLLGWVGRGSGCKTPEDSRVQLEAWLPKREWPAINCLLVGVGQLLSTVEGRAYLLRRTLSVDGKAGGTPVLALELLEKLDCPLLFKDTSGKSTGGNLLHWAADSGRADVVKFIVKRKASRQAGDADGYRELVSKCLRMTDQDGRKPSEAGTLLGARERKMLDVGQGS